MSSARAVDVIMGTDGFDVRLDDGRRLWPEVDEDLSVEGLLRGTAANQIRRSG
jgi:hypothetical protein